MTDHSGASRLRAAARAKSEAKTEAAERAVRELTKTGTSINFRTVAQQAAVSHSFLYAHPDLRSRIEHLRGQQHSNPSRPAEPSSESALVQTLTSKISQLKQRHRAQLDDVRTALERAHGENLALRRLLTEHGIHPPDHGLD